MKPENWNELSPELKNEIATELFNSARGKYIISQALYLGAGLLDCIHGTCREQQNIDDMEIMFEGLFPIFWSQRDVCFKYFTENTKTIGPDGMINWKEVIDATEKKGKS